MSKSNRNWIQVRSGLRVDLLEPSKEVVRVSDIAHALSRLCRYTGHTSRFYSVAEHSVRVSWKVAQLAPAGVGHLSRSEVAAWALFHDATEAYLGDISRPLKQSLPAMTEYRELEAKWMAAIAQAVGLVGTEVPELVEKIDSEILGTEAYHLMQPIHPDWCKAFPTGKLPEVWTDVGFMGWDSREAEDHFLIRFDELFTNRRVEK